MHSFPSPGADLAQPLSRHLPNIALQKSSTLLSVSSWIIYEMTVEIQNLDDEFYLLFRTRTPKEGSPQRHRGLEGRNGFKFRVRLMVSVPVTPNSKLRTPNPKITKCCG